MKVKEKLKYQKLKLGKVAKRLGLSDFLLIKMLDSQSGVVGKRMPEHFLSEKELEFVGSSYVSAVENLQKEFTSNSFKKETRLDRIIDIIKYFTQFIYTDESLQKEIECVDDIDLPRSRQLIKLLSAQKVQRELVLDFYFNRVFENDVILKTTSSFSFYGIHKYIKFYCKRKAKSKYKKGFLMLFRPLFYIYPKEDEEKRDGYNLLQIGLSRMIYSEALNINLTNLSQHKWNKKITFS